VPKIERGFAGTDGIAVERVQSEGCVFFSHLQGAFFSFLGWVVPPLTNEKFIILDQ
jgi:hypothetical protein